MTVAVCVFDLPSDALFLFTTSPENKPPKKTGPKVKCLFLFTHGDTRNPLLACCHGLFSLHAFIYVWTHTRHHVGEKVNVLRFLFIFFLSPMAIIGEAFQLWRWIDTRTVTADASKMLTPSHFFGKSHADQTR